MLRKVFFLVLLLSLCTACYSQKPRADVSGAYLASVAEKSRVETNGRIGSSVKV